MRNPQAVWFWPAGRDDLIEVQRELAAAAPGDWTPPAGDPLVGGCFVCFPRGHTGRGSAGDPAWAAAALIRGRRRYGHYLTIGSAGAAYEPGLLALRMGEILEAAVRGLPESPDVLLVDATGRDHPRRAGLALHLSVPCSICRPSVSRTARWSPPVSRQRITPVRQARWCSTARSSAFGCGPGAVSGRSPYTPAGRSTPSLPWTSFGTAGAGGAPRNRCAKRVGSPGSHVTGHGLVMSAPAVSCSCVPGHRLSHRQPIVGRHPPEII